MAHSSLETELMFTFFNHGREFLTFSIVVLVATGNLLSINPYELEVVPEQPILFKQLELLRGGKF